DLKVRAGKSFPQEHLQITAEAKRRFGISERCRLSKNENAKSFCRLFSGHGGWRGDADELLRKKSQTEFVVFYQDGLPPDLCLSKKRGGISDARDMQDDFERQQQKRRNKRHGQETKQDQSSCGDGNLRSCGCRPLRGRAG